MTDVTSGTDPTPRSGVSGITTLLPQRSFGLKLLLVCALALLMAIPALFVFTVVYDRSARESSAVFEVGQRYGGDQTVMGPALSVPYSITVPDGDETKTVYGIVVGYAEEGRATATIDSEEKTRGIHVVPVYDAQVEFDASFDIDRLRDQLPRGAEVYWSDAKVYLGLTDMRGTKVPSRVSVGDRTLEVEPVAFDNSWRNDLQDRYYASPSSNGRLVAGSLPELETLEGPVTVNAQMQFTGAQRLSFAPFAKNTTVAITSDWEDPSFEGGFRPTDYVNDEDSLGFTAEWSVPYEARGVPGAGRNLSFNAITAQDTDMAVRLIKTTSPYQSVQRALKYALMFIGFVFLAYFLFEVTSGERAHPAQYILVGLAQSVFYLMLLAFSEQLGFDLAFGIAATLTVLLTSGYAATVFKQRSYGLRALGILTGVYGLIYVLMRMEDYALLVGALASFLAIALTMWMTRNIDWYGMGRGTTSAHQTS